MVTLDLSAKQLADFGSAAGESAPIISERPAAACRFALMPTQLLVESADPMMLLSDTVSRLTACNYTWSFTQAR